MTFAGKTVVVTGAAGGIGARTAARFHESGAHVVILDIDAAAAASVADTMPGAMAVTADVSSPDELRDMVQTVSARFGGIDVLINNAMSCSESSFLEISPAEVHRDVDVSLLGPFFASQQVIPGMIEGGGGVILNVSSVNALGYFGNEAYSAAKAGLLNLTKSIASQFGAQGIRCNAVAPGTVATAYWEKRTERDPHVLEHAAQWYPLGRVGTPDDIAEALHFLASDAASWISGVTLPIDGGLMSGNLAMTQGIVPLQRGD